MATLGSLRRVRAPNPLFTVPGPGLRSSRLATWDGAELRPATALHNKREIGAMTTRRATLVCLPPIDKNHRAAAPWRYLMKYRSNMAQPLHSCLKLEFQGEQGHLQGETYQI